MKRSCIYFILSLFLCTLISSNLAAQEVPDAVKEITKSKLTKLAAAPEVVSAVKAQNAKNVPLSKIKEIDTKWKETSGLDDFMKAMLANSCSEHLKKLRKSNPYIVESFVMDNQGANVGMTNKTTNYWRGDKEKFTKCFNNGNGTVWFGKVAFDESCQSYVIQVSVPVKDNGKTIGTITFGLDTRAL